MMISISAKETDTVDGVVFQEDGSSEFRKESARVQRSKTLDGGSVIDHRGFSDGDRTFNIVAFLDEDTVDDLWYIFRNHTLVNLSCKEGFFEGAIADMKDQHGRVELTFLVKA